MLYVASELERMNDRSVKLGQLIKLNPYNQDNPYIWGIPVPKDHLPKGGIWATPALHDNYLYVATHTGKLLVVEKETGEVTFEDKIGDHAWSSPVIVDNNLLVGICMPTGGFRQYSLENPALPKLTNNMSLESGACIESTPAVWKGNIYVGARDGYLYSFEEKE
jgi:outer membrane protein assembly factor BamB